VYANLERPQKTNIHRHHHVSIAAQGARRQPAGQSAASDSKPLVARASAARPAPELAAQRRDLGHGEADVGAARGAELLLDVRSKLAARLSAVAGTLVALRPGPAAGLCPSAAAAQPKEKRVASSAHAQSVTREVQIEDLGASSDGVARVLYCRYDEDEPSSPLPPGATIFMFGIPMMIGTLSSSRLAAAKRSITRADRPRATR
ncbi:MAG TPA: hypothetical protein VG474_17485, partial [Solirubrobacteraceae bacterium]|nr:hypothetical protein [Solirubrobacteraceae bacterium]